MTVDGKPVRAKRKTLRGAEQAARLVCSRKDELERPTIYELLPKEWGHLHSVGRLDYRQRRIDFPDQRRRIQPAPDASALRGAQEIRGDGGRPGGAGDAAASSRRACRTQGEKLKAEKARLISASKAQSVVELELAEGKNREVRRLFESQGLTVKRLQRIADRKNQAGRVAAGQMADIDRTGD